MNPEKMTLLEKRDYLLRELCGANDEDPLYLIIEEAFEVGWSSGMPDEDAESTIWNMLEAAIGDLNYAQKVVNA